MTFNARDQRTCEIFRRYSGSRYDESLSKVRQMENGSALGRVERIAQVVLLNQLRLVVIRHFRSIFPLSALHSDLCCITLISYESLN